MGQIKITIDGVVCEAEKNDTILKVARKNGIYIPTLCYLSKCEPIASCRLCVIEAENHEGLLLGCQTKVVDGLVVNTNSQRLAEERKKIMQLYCVNHPLECGVCDKSGECELQNKTLEFGVTAQKFMAKEQNREIKNWGVIQYDPSLCILCEKCVHTCNEIIGDDAIEIKVGGYKSQIGPKNSETLDCTLCGECIAVCPVGALVSTGFKYASNAWELKRVPSACAHCSSACGLYYEFKHTKTEAIGEKIYRVTNDFEFSSLCNAGRFGFDYDNTASKDQKAFEKAITALKSASYIKFNSFITNEEALILQKIKEKTGIRLVNKDAYEYKKFIEAYSAVSGKSLYSGNLDDIRNSDGIIVLGSMISAENPAVRYAVNSASKRKNAKVVYMHPIEDPLLATNVNKFVKYEPKSEEGVMAILASLFGGEGLDGESKRFFEDLDIGYVSSESSFDESEQEEIVKLFLRAKNKTLILGQDLYSHPRAENIAKLAALFEKASGFKVVIIPSQTNTLGVSMICDIDKEGEGFSVGYNEEGDFILTSFGSKQRDNALDMPALNQQEGTFVSIDKRVVPLNAAIEFKGYELNDLANAIGINKEFTIDYTKELPVSKGFKSISFDDLPNKFLNDGTEDRGYILDTKDTETSTSIEDVAELEEMNGEVVYAGSTVNGFSEATSICKQLAYEPDALYVGKGAMEKYALEENETVTIKLGSQSAKYKVAHDGKISSDIVIAASFEPNNPMFETLRDGYAFKRIEIIKG